MSSEYIVYKSDISYFSGKLEAFLRYKGIPYEAVECGRAEMRRIAIATGIQKMPAVELRDGRWLYDSTPTLAWFEERHPEPSTVPEDPALAFLALLVEDYGDEWLWRPAMWWRWVPIASRRAVGYRIGRAFAPRPLASVLSWLFGARQRREWLWGDGVHRGNEAAVRDMLLRELEFLEDVFARRPFLLGNRPTAADFGYFASMFRHFGNDPDPAEVVRREAPRTYEWLARVWNPPGERAAPAVWQWPEIEVWRPLLERICGDYLPYLHQNALAFREGRKRFDYRGAHLAFEGTQTTHYRVYCRERLQQQYGSLDEDARTHLEEMFAGVGGLEILLRDGTIASGLADRFHLPQEAVGDAASVRGIWGQARN